MVKQRSKTAPLKQEGDGPAITIAIDWCIAQGLGPVRPTKYQLKIGTLNYYPDSGTIQHDGEKALKVRGFEAFKRHVLRQLEVTAALEDHEYPVSIKLRV